MWRLTIRSPESEPREIEIRPGVNSIGRLSTNDIVIQDTSASRRHAELTYEQSTDTLTIRDLESTNGIFVNRQRITAITPLLPNDVIRIGQVTINTSRIGTGPGSLRVLSGTHPFSRDLLLEALDQNAVLLYEVAKRLNTVLEIDTALSEVNLLIKRALGADGCEIIMAKDFPNLENLGIPPLISEETIHKRSATVVPDLAISTSGDLSLTSGPTRVRAAICVPVIGGDDVLAIIFIYRTGLNNQVFDQRDLQLAIAVSHQAALTLQRMVLLDRVRQEERAQQLLRRFLPPKEAGFLLHEYLETGHLPGLQERKITVMFSDIEDSTMLAECLGMQHFALILNNFYNAATEITFKRGGVIRYLGDGIMAVFTENADHPTPEVEAVQAAIELIHRSKTTGHLDADNRVVIGVSIYTGMAMMGYVGTQERAEFTVLGDTVNVAFRMQEYARPYKILVGPATMAAVVGKFQTQRIGEVSLRGRERSIQIYEILL